MTACLDSADTSVPLHAVQTGVYYDQLLHPASAKYNIGGYIRFVGRFDPERWQTVLACCWGCYDAERMVLQHGTATPQLRFDETLEMPVLQSLDFCGAPDAAAQASRWVQQRMDTVFDLQRAPLFEQALLRIAEREYWYFSRHHHLIADAYSFSLKIARLLTRYAQRGDEDDATPIKAPTYRSEILRSAAYADSADRAADAEYWRLRCRDLPPPLWWPEQQTSFAADSSQLASGEVRSVQLSVNVPEDLRLALQTLATQLGATPLPVLLALVGTYVAETWGESDFIVGVPTHNRVYRAQKQTFGMLASVVPSRLRYRSDRSLRVWIQRIIAEQSEDLQHRHYPWADILHDARDSDVRRMSLFDIAVNYEPFLAWPPLDGLQVSAHERSSQAEDIPVHVKLCDFGATLPMQLKLDVAPGLLGSGGIEVFADDLLALMRQRLASADLAAADLRRLRTPLAAVAGLRPMPGWPPVQAWEWPPVEGLPGTSEIACLAQVLPASFRDTWRAATAASGVAAPLLWSAAWALLLSRCCGAEAVPLAISAAGISAADPASDHYFRLPLQVSPRETLRDYVRCVLRLYDDVQYRQKLFGGDHVPAADLDGSCVAALSTQAASSLTLPAAVALCLQVYEDDARWHCNWIYDTARLSAATVRRWQQQWSELVAAFAQTLSTAAAAATARVGELPLLTSSERKRIVEEFNATDAAYPEHALIHARFSEQALRTPMAVAMSRYGDDGRLQTMSYAQLDAQAERLARRLRVERLRPDDRVAIIAERSFELVVGVLAILKAGAAYVPLDPTHPPERLAELLADAAPRLLLSTPACETCVAVPTLPRWVLQLDALQADREMHADESPSSPMTPMTPTQPQGASSAEDAAAAVTTADTDSDLTARHLAYVIYTSGSTGRPKGVMVEHRSVLRLVVNAAYTTLDADDCIALCANPAFDAATWELWAALLNGARLHVVPQATLLDAQALNRELQSAAVTALFMSVGLYNAYADALGEAFARLKYLFVGGDVLDPRAIAKVANAAQRPLHFRACYGPTETTTFASMHELGHIAPDVQTIPIGTPISNTRMYILDELQQPVPIGVRGELYIGGPGVARGYLQQPERTAAQFVADPFSACADARLYKTGDLARYRADGCIEFLGRRDFQLKIRGFRVELGEIEAQLRKLRAVEDGAVVAVDGPGGQKRIIAYVVARAGEAQACTPAQLHAELSRRLPEYLRPRGYVLLPQLPLNTNGKIDRAALRAREVQADFSVADFVAPRSDAERLVAAVWAELLGLPRIGMQDDLMLLGWHSLLATQAVSRLRDIFQIDIPLRVLLDAPSVAKVLAALGDAWGSGEAVEDIAAAYWQLQSLSDAEVAAALLQHATVAPSSSVLTESNPCA